MQRGTGSDRDRGPSAIIREAANVQGGSCPGRAKCPNLEYYEGRCDLCELHGSMDAKRDIDRYRFLSWISRTYPGGFARLGLTVGDLRLHYQSERARIAAKQRDVAQMWHNKKGPMSVWIYGGLDQ